ncbi:MAG: Mrp/NBP35 family ATP-binding protein [Chloroflexota bacterium]
MSVDTRQEEVLNSLRVVRDPDLHRDIVSLGFVQNLKIEAGRVGFDIVLTTPACPVKDRLQEEAERAVRSLPWVTEVSVAMEAQTRVGRAAGENEQLIPKVKNVIAIASGKGGVGKSTTSANVALALAETGARVGLMDADMYGPNIPLMMGLKQRPELQNENGKIIPCRGYGIRLMSIGFFLDPDNPVIWRGPMVHGAIQQFLRDVDWGELDYLVIDLPPGTGDVPLSLSQLIPLSGAVIVTTPQDVALQDVAKGMAMFQKLEVPIIGVVENMSYFICPGCQQKHEIFGSGGGQKIADQFGVPLLGRIPLEPRVREGGDEGRPIVVTAPDSPVAVAIRDVAGEIARRVSILAFGDDGDGLGSAPSLTVVKK